MSDGVRFLNRFSSFKIVLLYAIMGTTYILTSDYFLKQLFSDSELLSKHQTTKGLAFILTTSVLLYFLIKRNNTVISSYFLEIIGLKKLSNEQLIRSKEEYMFLFNHSPLPTWLFDIDTLEILMVNEAACSIYGYTEEEYSTMNLRDIRPEEDIPYLEQKISELTDHDRNVLPSVMRHRKKNGDIIYVKVKSSSVYLDSKKVKLASAFDVTAEMEHQKQLLDINAKLRAASEIANLGYWTFNLVSLEVQWSKEVYDIFEVDAQKFIPTLDSITAHFHVDDQFEFDENLFDGFEDHIVRESERRIITGTGKTKWLLERQYLTKDTNGVPVKLEGIVLDITKRKVNEQEVWESNERFKILAKATTEAVMDWDLKNKSVIWGEGFKTLFGFDQNLDKNFWAQNIHPEDKKRVLSDLLKAIKDPTVDYFNAEFKFINAKGNVVYVRHNGIFIRDEAGKVTRAIGAMIDLTETLERIERIELQDKILKEIAYTQSHVIRAPLANLLGFLKLYKDNKRDGLFDDEYIDYITHSAEKLDSIIHEIVNKSTRNGKS
jgi:PAS domain S-box-containing protein